MVTLLVVIWMGGLKLWEWVGGWVSFVFCLFVFFLCLFVFFLVNLVEVWVILWLGGLKL